MHSKFGFRALLVLLILFSGSAAFAKDSKNYKKAKSALKDIADAEAKLRKSYSALTPTEQARLLVSQPSTLLDSDSDGVCDSLEHAIENSDTCSDDSDGDGHSDVSEREGKGKITSVGSDTFTVKSTVWKFDGSTVYEDGSQANLVIGVCVEVKGHTSGAELIATNVEFKNADDCR